MIPYARQSIDDSDVECVVEVLRSDFLTQGPSVERFEDAVAGWTGARHAVATCNATSALHIACLAVGVGNGDLVWTSPNSFVASANCALYCGASVDFVDIDRRTYTISIAELEAKLVRAARTGHLPKAVVAVDFAGQPSQLQEIASLRDRYGFRLIEDASHAVGALYKDTPVGSGGHADITVFSFHPVKIVTTAEGGMALTNDGDIAKRMRLLRSHGVTRDTAMMSSPREPWEYEQIDLGFNYRLTDLQAALGISQMKRLNAFLARRRQIAARYDAALRELPVTLPYQHPDGLSAYHLYPICVEEAESGISRRQLYERLVRSGIRPNVHYIPIHLQPYYRRMGFKPGDFAQAESYYARALSLPMYPGLSDVQQEQVISVLKGALR